MASFFPYKLSFRGDRISSIVNSTLNVFIFKLDKTICCHSLVEVTQVVHVPLQMFVRLFVDENLDRLVPISKQPKEKILAIIKSCNRQFPEFRDRARKRIRTYLKSCRRLKKLKEPLKRAADQMVSRC